METPPPPGHWFQLLCWEAGLVRLNPGFLASTHTCSGVAHPLGISNCGTNPQLMENSIALLESGQIPSWCKSVLLRRSQGRSPAGVPRAPLELHSSTRCGTGPSFSSSPEKVTWVRQRRGLGSEESHYGHPRPQGLPTHGCLPCWQSVCRGLSDWCCSSLGCCLPTLPGAPSSAVGKPIWLHVQEVLSGCSEFWFILMVL